MGPANPYLEISPLRSIRAGLCKEGWLSSPRALGLWRGSNERMHAARICSFASQGALTGTLLVGCSAAAVDVDRDSLGPVMTTHGDEGPPDAFVPSTPAVREPPAGSTGLGIASGEAGDETFDSDSGDGEPIALCGDGEAQDGEECDDGNRINTDDCLATCILPMCGDGIIHLGVEECDDANTSNEDACVEECVVASCGDGFVRAGVEACDDGNTDNSDDCTNDCRRPNCGDGITQTGEECDDGNDDDTDACLSTCLFASCGDGFLREDSEVCDGLAGVGTCDDEGYDSGTLTCSSSCTLDTSQCGTCGNGMIDGDESCDDDDFGELDCKALGYTGGRLQCADDCRSISDEDCRNSIIDIIFG